MHIFAWDHRKSEANALQRGFDFNHAARIFEGITVERVDVRRDYGEPRVLAIGVVDGEHLTVIYTDRVVSGGNVRRIISARHSNRRERIEYGNSVPHFGESRPRKS